MSAPIAQPTSLARTGAYAARLNAGGSAPRPLGPLVQLAVQQGDTVTVSAPGLYPQAVQRSFWFSLASFISGILHPANGTSAGPDPTRGRAGLPLLQIGVVAGLTTIPQLSGGVPKGYVRVLVFNADSALVSQQTQQLTTLALNNYEPLRLRVVVPQDGYVTAYVGNESEVDVYFDDVTVEYRQGLQVQETAYDPTGLELVGVPGSSPGLKRLNQYKFNGKEFQADLGLNWNHHDWRFIDPPRGPVWHGVDPMIEEGQENWTPYAFGFNNAVRYSDPDGQFPPLLVAGAVGAVVGAVIGAGVEAGTQMYKNGGNVSDWHAVGGAALQGGVTGGVAGLTGGTSLLRSGAAGAISSVAGGIARNVHDGKPVTVGSVAKDATVGAVIGVAGYGAGKAVGAVVNRFKGGTAATVTQNAKQGAAFEKVVTKQLKASGHTDVAEQVTVKPGGLQANGDPYPNVRLDNVSRDQTGAVILTDAKSSATAGLTKNQKIGYPALQQNGGKVMGNNGAAHGYPEGFSIPPTTVSIVRPK